jgi:hypothetical protein
MTESAMSAMDQAEERASDYGDWWLRRGRYDRGAPTRTYDGSPR